MNRWIGLFLMAGLSLQAGADCAFGQSVRGQSLRGRVMVAEDTLPVPGADVFLADSLGAVLSHVTAGDDGAFHLPVPEPGSFRIRASRLGFATIRASVVVRENELVEVELRMAAEAIPMEPIVVTARKQIRLGSIEEFYDRMARMKQAGRGQFLTQEEIEAWGDGVQLPILLQTVPGVWALPTGRTEQSIVMRNPGPGGPWCSPEFYLDGIPMQWYRDIYPFELEGVEVYRGVYEPVDGYWTERCGTIFLWRKEHWAQPNNRRRMFALAGFAVVMGLITAFFAW